MMTSHGFGKGYVLKSRLRRVPSGEGVRPLSLEPIPEDTSAEFFNEDPSILGPLHQLQLVNLERRRYGCIPFKSSPALDSLALKQAMSMAQSGRVFHSVRNIDQLKFNLRSNTVAENVQRGADVATMHEETMAATETVNRTNMLSTSFDEFGAGVSVGKDGKVYLCHIFRKS